MKTAPVSSLACVPEKNLCLRKRILIRRSGSITIMRNCHFLFIELKLSPNYLSYIEVIAFMRLRLLIKELPNT
jgi:hypothetical protein